MRLLLLASAVAVIACRDVGLALPGQHFVHQLGTGGDDGAKFATVDQFGGAGLLMAGYPGDLLDWDSACGHDADERVPQLPGYPFLTQPRGAGDLAELAADVVLVQHGPDRRGDDKAAVLPQLPHLQAVG